VISHTTIVRTPLATSHLPIVMAQSSKPIPLVSSETEDTAQCAIRIMGEPTLRTKVRLHVELGGPSCTSSTDWTTSFAKWPSQGLKYWSTSGLSTRRCNASRWRRLPRQVGIKPGSWNALGYFQRHLPRELNKLRYPRWC
jgi:hypothetical protein